MSVWCEVSGQIRMNVSEHCSIREAIRNFFDEVSISTVDSNKVYGAIVTDVDFCLCAEGIGAAKKIDAFVNMLKAKYPSVRTDLSANIRFFY